MGAGSSMSRNARKQNKKIETTLRKDKLEQVNVIKLLLLGQYLRPHHEFLNFVPFQTSIDQAHRQEL